MKFNDRALKSLNPETGERITLSDDGCTGLMLKASTRSKVFYCDYRFQGERRRLKIGPYPEISLHDARQRVRQILLDIGNGIDPRPQVAKGPTVLDAIEEYERLHLGSLKSGGERSTMLRRELAKSFDKQIADVTRNDLELILKAKRKEGKIGNRVRANLMAFFNWVHRNTTMLPTGNPAAILGKPQKEVAGERVLEMEELQEIWTVAADLPAVRLLLLTAARRTEITDLKWSEVNLAETRIELTGNRTKNGKAHFIHLSEPAMRIINDQHEIGEYVFTRQQRTLNRVMTKLPEFDTPWRLHDFRRAAATHLSEAGTPAEVVELMLGHKLRGIMKVYNRAERLQERAEALDLWGSYFDAE